MSIEVRIGDRVGVMVSCDKDTVHLLGFGTFNGLHVPPAPYGVEKAVFGAVTWEERDQLARDMIAEDRAAMKEEGIAEADLPPQDFVPPRPEAPQITLDTGETVWGHECWWGPEVQVRSMMEGRRVVEVPYAEFIAGA